MNRRTPRSLEPPAPAPPQEPPRLAGSKRPGRGHVTGSRQSSNVAVRSQPVSDPARAPSSRLATRAPHRSSVPRDGSPGLLAPRNASLTRRLGPSPPLHDLAPQHFASLRSAAQAPSPPRWAPLSLVRVWVSWAAGTWSRSSARRTRTARTAGAATADRAPDREVPSVARTAGSGSEYPRPSWSWH